jgi:hypothetical protein
MFVVQGVHCGISIYAYSVPWLDSAPPSFSLDSASWLKQFHQISLLYFHISIRSTPTTFASFTLPVTLSLPLPVAPTPEQDPPDIAVLHLSSGYSLFKGVSRKIHCPATAVS